MKNKDIQKRIDKKKWVDSEAAHKDLCGAYIYCKYCNKDKKHPCASAYNKFMKQK